MNTYIAITIVIAVVLWLAYELWSAPVGEETEQGYREIKPGRKLKDLFKSEKQK